MTFKEKLDHEQLKIRLEILEKLSALLTAAFGLVAALAWNNAIQKIFAQFFQAGEEIWPMVIYALVVTIIAVVATMIIGGSVNRAKQRIDTKNKKKK